jgi:cytochrome c peroxidase
MDHYNKGDGITNPWLDKDMQPLALNEPEIDDVVAFLASLTSPAVSGTATISASG